jgi:hypothetical protein
MLTQSLARQFQKKIAQQSSLNITQHKIPPSSELSPASIKIGRYTEGLRCLYKSNVFALDPNILSRYEYGQIIDNTIIQITVFEEIVNSLSTTSIIQLVTPFIVIPNENEYEYDECDEYNEYNEYYNNNNKIILYCHGNCENLPQLISLGKMYAKANYTFVAFDYNGYRMDGKVPSEDACYMSSLIMFQYLVNTLNYDPKNIIIFGRSVGSGVATHLAKYLSDHNYIYGGLFLQSPIASCLSVASYWLTYLMQDMFVNYKKIQDVKRPICIMHALNDTIVPVDNTKLLVSKVRPGKLFRSIIVTDDNTNHNNMDVENWDLVIQTINNFFQYINSL